MRLLFFNYSTIILTAYSDYNPTNSTPKYYYTYPPVPQENVTYNNSPIAQIENNVNHQNSQIPLINNNNSPAVRIQDNANHQNSSTPLINNNNSNIVQIEDNVYHQNSPIPLINNSRHQNSYTVDNCTSQDSIEIITENNKRKSNENPVFNVKHLKNSTPHGIKINFSLWWTINYSKY